jgi:Virulence factor
MSKSDTAGRGMQLNHRQARPKGIIMPEVTIVYWRDIPAQIIVGKGRSGSKVKLTERFEQAIDRCAMKIGAKDADAYLAEWRKAAPVTVEGEPDAVAASEAARIETEYDTARLKSLIAADGWASGR